MKIFWIILISVVSTILCIILGLINWTLQFIVVGIIYFAISALISFWKINYWKAAILLLPFILIYDIAWILVGITYDLPIAIIPLLTGFLGYLLTRKQVRKVIYTRTIIAGFIILIIGLLFMPNWFSYASSKKAYLRYKFPNVELYYENGKKFDKKDFFGKITIFDFWDKSCGLCYKQFPEIETFSRSLDTNQFKLYVVNMPIYDTINERRVLDSMNYSFKKLSLGQTISMCKDQLHINGVPIILIIDPEGYVFYKGLFFNKKYIFINNINKILNKVKKNYQPVFQNHSNS